METKAIMLANPYTYKFLKGLTHSALERLNIGSLENWIIGTLEHSTFNQHQLASCDINCIDSCLSDLE